MSKLKLLSIISIFIILGILRFIAIDAYSVRGDTMEPTLHDGYSFYINKLVYKFQPPQRGDIVVFTSLNIPDITFIKRIIAIPGDKVKIQNGSVYLNNEELMEPYLEGGTKTHFLPQSLFSEGMEIIVPPDNYFVLGDNRPRSSDSREFGYVPKSMILGQMIQFSSFFKGI